MQPEVRENAGEQRQTPVSAVGASPDAGGFFDGWLKALVVGALAGLFLSFVGALETGRLPLPIRLAYWMPLMLGGTVVGLLLSWAVGKIPRARTNTWAFGALLAFVIALPITLIVWGYTRLLFATNGPPLGPLFGSVLMISAAMTALMILVTAPGRVTHAAPDGGAVQRVRFLDRLPPKLKGAVLYAVSAEDHYLRLHTSKGADLILMRLSDAIAELDGLEGAQTHRSWWVAKDAVESARRDGDKMVLTLKGGAEAPVSRPNVRPLREAGWY